MCFYAATLYHCGDWKWGNMKERCPKQHRIGEVCGRKFFDHENTSRVREDCRLCQDIKTKEGRLDKERSNIKRWRQEGGKFTSSIEKAEALSRELELTIEDMRSRRMQAQHAISSRQGGDFGGAGRHASSVSGYGGGGHAPSHDRHAPQHGQALAYRSANDRNGSDRHGSRHG